MICPYCDSRLSVLPDNRVCPYCGAPLGALEEKPLSFPEPPLGIYKAAAGYLEIGKNSVTFCRKHYFKAYKRTIPYSQIHAVCYQPGKFLNAGHLCVRQWQDRHLPMPVQAAEVVGDATTVYFRESKNAQFCEVYAFLRQCADIVSKANKDRQWEETSLYGRYPGFYGYMEIGAQALTVYKDIKLRPATKCVIAYDEIAEVAFCEAKGLGRGGLSIRRRGDDKRMDQALHSAIIDDTSIDFTVSANEQMQRIYLQLAAYADENNSRWMHQSDK